MGKSYLNKIDEVEVSLAIEQLLIAPSTQAWVPARIDVSSPPSGFVNLGAVVEDSPVMRYNREKFQLQTGIPMVTQFESIMSMEGSFECQLHSNSWRKVQYALGNFSAVSSATVVSSIASVIDSANFLVTSVASLSLHRQYIFASTPGAFDRADTYEARVTAISTVSSFWQITISAPMLKTPAAGWVIGHYDFVRQVFGTSQIQYYKLLGVSDFIDGVQVVHQLHKVSPSGEFTEEFRPNENARFPLAFSALGVETTINSCTELIIGDRFYFPKSSQC